jgi:AcrR family transcriptional regulator
VRKELMRRHILEKCLEIFSNTSAEKLSMEEIARFCSITKPTLYSYFKNREGILFALFNEITDRLLERLRGCHSQYCGDRSSWACFERIFDEIISFFHTHRPILMLLMRETHRMGSGDDIDEHIKLWMEKRETVMAFFEEIFSPMIRDESMRRKAGRVVAVSVFQIISGILAEFFFTEEVRVDQYRTVLRELLQNGLFVKEAR